MTIMRTDRTVGSLIEIVLAQKGIPGASTSLVHARDTEGYRLIEFEISDSTLGGTTCLTLLVFATEFVIFHETIMEYYGIEWSGMLWSSMPCYAMLCYAMLCCTMLRPSEGAAGGRRLQNLWTDVSLSLSLSLSMYVYIYIYICVYMFTYT